jgi:hypothetical protein
LLSFKQSISRSGIFINGLQCQAITFSSDLYIRQRNSLDTCRPILESCRKDKT